MKGALRFTVAATCVVATVLPACSSSKSDAARESEPADAKVSDAAVSSTNGADAAPADAATSADAAAPTACAKDDDCTSAMECSGGKCVPRAVCPVGLEPTFDSIHTKIFAVSCGTDGNACHSHNGAIYSAGLNLADDPYTALLGSDGKGELAGNISGSVKDLRRVVPGDPDDSFLVIKLSTRTGMDPKYGSGMPFTDPGSVCPDTLTTIRAWISAGAKN
ncbi:MAG TPA: hypothetical protein VHC69_14800 [Polyangiaceae bacterium]|nr:hypothetical protein [Polyangiaceae bacterium]